jgi:hypothetical protein
VPATTDPKIDLVAAARTAFTQNMRSDILSFLELAQVNIRLFGIS